MSDVDTRLHLLPVSIGGLLPLGWIGGGFVALEACFSGTLWDLAGHVEPLLGAHGGTRFSAGAASYATKNFGNTCARRSDTPRSIRPMLLRSASTP